jgi:glycosyltransferase involved in cell wall biosynthesis
VERARLPTGRVEVAPTGVDVERFGPLGASARAAVRERIGVAPDEHMLLCVGRIDPTKGAIFLIEAAKRLKGRVTIIVCGASSDDPYLGQVKEEMAQLNAAATGVRADYLGHRSDVPALMAAADLVVVPSVWPDPQPLVISEAMASGTPVVGFKMGGIADSLAGFPDQLVSPRDTVALAEAIERCISWRRTDPGLGDRCRKWAVDHMSIARSTETVNDLLTAVLVHGAPLPLAEHSDIGVRSDSRRAKPS